MPRTPRRPIRSIVSWMKRHRARLSTYALLTIVGGYATTYTLVAHAVSPAHHIASDAVAYQRWIDERAPDGAVVLIHGAPANASTWSALINALDDEKNSGATWPVREFVAIDRPGYGNTQLPEDITLRGQARAIESLFDRDINEPMIVIGHSYGGPVALRCAVEYPDRVDAVVILAGACDPYMEDSAWFRRTIDAASPIVPAEWESSNRELLALTEDNRAMESLLKDVTCPVIIVHGTWDPVCPHDGTVSYLQGALTSAERVEVISLERTGHAVHVSHPDRVLDAIRGALDTEH